MGFFADGLVCGDRFKFFEKAISPLKNLDGLRVPCPVLLLFSGSSLTPVVSLLASGLFRLGRSPARVAGSKRFGPREFDLGF